MIFVTGGNNMHIVESFSRKLDCRPSVFDSNTYLKELDKVGLAAFIVKINPEQTYFPKISSKVLENGSMESNPLHLMTPALPENLSRKFFKYIDG